MEQVSVRYIVNDVDAVLPFYTEQLGFKLDMHPAPPFAMLSRGPLRLLLNEPGGQGGAGQAGLDGKLPEPGGWNRFQLEVDDLESMYRRLQAAGVPLRTAVIQGVGGKQALVEDPSGNVVELFEAPR